MRVKSSLCRTAGMVLRSNLTQGRLCWSRSSCTDQDVHAAYGLLCDAVLFMQLLGDRLHDMHIAWTSSALQQTRPVASPSLP